MFRASRVESVLGELGPLADPGYRDRLAKFGSHPAKALGVTMPQLRKLAKSLGRDQELALGLWESGVHEARILATLVAELGQMTVAIADAWVGELDSWDVCDQACTNLFRHCPGPMGRRWFGLVRSRSLCGKLGL